MPGKHKGVSKGFLWSTANRIGKQVEAVSTAVCAGRVSRKSGETLPAQVISSIGCYHPAPRPPFTPRKEPTMVI